MKGKLFVFSSVNVALSSTIYFLLAFRLGVGLDLDNYFVYTLPALFFFNLSFTIFRQVLIPIWNDDNYLSGGVYLFSWLFLRIAYIFIFTSSISLFYCLISHEDDLIYFYTLASIFISIYCALFLSYQLSRSAFVVQEIILFLANIFVVLSILIIPLNLLAEFSWFTLPMRHLVIIFFILLASRISFSFTVDNDVVDYFIKKTAPVFLSSLIFKSDLFINRFISIFLGEGFASVISLSQQLISVYHTLVSKVLLAPQFNQLMKLNIDSKKISIRKLSNILILFSVFLCLIAGMVLFVLKESSFLYAIVQKYSLDNILTFVLFCSGALVFSSSSQAMAQFYYAEGDTLTPSRIGVLTYLIILPSKLFLVVFLGVPGLGISVSLGALLVYLVYLYKFSRVS